ncbi:MAG: hypothetical protein IKT79_07000, partial [Akkermansia sp.]|nr:hypothetical protein [Akkermansia sp.]
LQIRLSSTNINTPLTILTLNGGGTLSFAGTTLDVLGEADGVRLVNGTTYKLIKVSNFTASQLNNITLDYGSLGYSGGYITYTYGDNSVWGALSDTWSSSRWNGVSKSTDGADVVFSNLGTNDYTVTISGTVSPSSINIEDGSYIFVGGFNAGFSGVNSVQVSGDSKLTTRLNINAANIDVTDNATFALELTAPATLSGLSSTANSTVIFGGSNGITYTLTSTDGLLGTTQVTANNTLALKTKVSNPVLSDIELDKGAVLQLSAGANRVEYSLSDNQVSGNGRVLWGNH